MIEAARWGGDVQMAAASCLADRIAAAGADLAALTLCLALSCLLTGCVEQFRHLRTHVIRISGHNRRR